MKSLHSFLIENINFIVKEGGNAIKSSSPIPATITPKVAKEILDKILVKYPNLKMAPLGSIGKKFDDETNGDIDIAINLTEYEELEAVLSDVFPGLEQVRLARIVTIGYPWSVDGKSGIAQCDFMLCEDIEWAKFRFYAPNKKTGESRYKGANRCMLLASIVRHIPVKDAETTYFEQLPEDEKPLTKTEWRHSFNEKGISKQFLNWVGTKVRRKKHPFKDKTLEQRLVTTPEDAMKFVSGPNYDERDFVSVESLWKMIHRDDFLWKEHLADIETDFYYGQVLDPKCHTPVDPKDFPCTEINPDELTPTILDET